MNKNKLFLLLLALVGLVFLPACSLVTAERTKDYFSTYSRYATDPEPKFYEYNGKTYVLVHRKDYSRRSSDWVTSAMTKEKFSYHEEKLPNGTSDKYLFELPKAHDVSVLARLYDTPVKYPMNREELYTHIFAKTKEASFIPVKKIPLEKAKLVQSAKVLKKEENPTCGYPTMSEYSHRSLAGKFMWPVEKVQMAAVDVPGSVILTTLATPAAPFAMTAQQVVDNKDELLHEMEEVKGKKNELLGAANDAKSQVKEVEASATDLKEKTSSVKDELGQVKVKGEKLRESAQAKKEEKEQAVNISASQQQTPKAPELPANGEKIMVEETGK